MVSFRTSGRCPTSFYAEVNFHGDSNREQGHRVPSNSDGETADQRQNQTVRPESAGVLAERRPGQSIHVVMELKPLLSELRACGRNLNQLTVLAHEGRIQDAMASVIHLIHLWTLLNKFPFIIKSEKGRNIVLNVPALLLFLFCLALLLLSFPVSKLPPPFLILKNIYISGSRTLGRRRASQTIQCYVIPHLQHN